MSVNVSLPPELENRVRQHVESGRYSSASEVIREALRLFEAYQGVQTATLASLKDDIAQGVADIAAGRVRELGMNEIKQRGRAKLAARQPASGRVRKSDIPLARKTICWRLGCILPRKTSTPPTDCST